RHRIDMTKQDLELRRKYPIPPPVYGISEHLLLKVLNRVTRFNGVACVSRRLLYDSLNSSRVAPESLEDRIYRFSEKWGFHVVCIGTDPQGAPLVYEFKRKR
ncbi:MAG: hypothetical protein L0Y75_06955, partial [Acidobacteria bacterium]|nr:hypothetical protein [Acidobacteriota bacterium]